MREELLAGGHINEVVRIGDTVRRPMPDRAPYVHDVLRMFAQHKWPGAPKYLGSDEQEREVLTYLEGHVAWEPAQPPDVWSEESLVRVAKLVRQFHDLTAGTRLAEDEEVVCHNDLSPKNTVYRDDGMGLRPYAFIDWDGAAPGRRLHDVAHVCWQFLDLGPRRSNPAGPARLLLLIADSYGLTTRDRKELVETILWWQDRCWRGIEAGASEGDPAMQALVDGGHVYAIHDAYAWVADHRAALEAPLV
ncbi:phosphotransferase [Actinopolymorpha alba]|uniref:phosphotransferase n=1 Tax=Actinopolymorpha alba TaxID=533267 RepID=UPI000369E787|nr:phosphotransferase [Actinopolymorpha alba]